MCRLKVLLWLQMLMKKLLFWRVSLARTLTVTTQNSVWTMSPLFKVSLFPARHLRDDVCGNHEAQVYFQLLEIMFD